MNISEIITERDKLKIEAAALQLRQNGITIKLMELNKLYNDTLMEEFLDYLKVDDQFTTNKNHFNLSKDINFLRGGDTIKIVKKNKKTVVVEYIKVMTFSDGTTKTNPITSKIDLNKLFNVYNSEEFKNILITRNTRRKRLEQLGI